MPPRHAKTSRANLSEPEVKEWPIILWFLYCFGTLIVALFLWANFDTTVGSYVMSHKDNQWWLVNVFFIGVFLLHLMVWVATAGRHSYHRNKPYLLPLTILCLGTSLLFYDKYWLVQNQLIVGIIAGCLELVGLVMFISKFLEMRKSDPLGIRGRIGRG